jgi:hypothetical protein
MIKIITLFTLIMLVTSCTTSQINKTIDGVLNEGTVSTAEVANGLKEALKQGTSKGTTQASQLNGYFANSLLKIVVPPEMQKAEQQLRSMGFNKLMDDFTLSLNRAAEEAAKKAKPVFVNAITAMTINDAWNILKGKDDAATIYLKQTTGKQLYESFKPVIKNALQQVNATKYYGDIANIYNNIPLVQPLNPDLDDYVTNKAIDGLFILIKQEEANIRNNASARVTDLLKKVFTKQNMGR